jgi:hypothetical protein
MAATEKETNKNIGNDATSITKVDPRFNKIDRTAPAGSENSLGAESVRDGRPATDDDVVEAIDEEDPGITFPPDSDKAQ